MTPEKRIEMAIKLIESTIAEEIEHIKQYPNESDYYKGRKSGLNSALILLGAKEIKHGCQKLG